MLALLNLIRGIFYCSYGINQNKPKKQYKYNRRYFCRITQYILLVYTHLVILQLVI